MSEKIQHLQGKPETGMKAAVMVGMTGPVIRGRAGRTPLPESLQDVLSPGAKAIVGRRSDAQEKMQGTA